MFKKDQNSGDETTHLRLWVDDERPAPPGWTWAKDYTSALLYLAGKKLTAISLDHDLGEKDLISLKNPHNPEEEAVPRPATGYDIATYLVENSLSPDILNVHSMNPVGAKAMQQLLQRARPAGRGPVTRYSPDEVRGGAAGGV